MNGGGLGTEPEPGVVEVMASPESDEPFTEDMINQVIAMLQGEGQITPETHTIIVHTPGGGPTLRVQIQQVDGNELDQNNIEEIGTESTVAGGDQDQLVYVGQPGDAPQYQQQQILPQQLLSDQQQMIPEQQQQIHHQQELLQSNNQGDLLQNGAQFISGSEQTMIDTMKSVPHYDNGVAYMTQEALQDTSAMDVATLNGSFNTMEAGMAYTTTTTSLNGTRQTAVIGAPHQPDNGNLGIHTTSLHNGVVLSYASNEVAQEPHIVEQSQSHEQQYSTSNGIMNSNNSVNGHLNISQNSSFSNYDGSSKMSSSTQYVDPRGGSSNSSYVQTITSRNQRKQPLQSAKRHMTSSHTIVDDVVRIKIDTGHISTLLQENIPDNVIRIATTTGQLKTRNPKFFRCTTCNMHFASETALLQHIRQGCSGSRKRTSYECTYCSSKFASKARTVEHLKICSMRWQAKTCAKSKSIVQGNSTGRVVSRKPTTQTVEVEINSDDEEETALRQEKHIVYDDDDDIDVDLAADNEDYETNLSKVSQKHLGPILTGGKYKCRDCERTFNKDAQYKRHIGVCTNAPLNSSRIDDVEKKPSIIDKKPRGRPRKMVMDLSRNIEPTVRSKPVAIVKDRNDAKYGTQKSNNKDELSDMDWDFLASPKKNKSSDVSSSKKANNIMDMLKENMGEGIIDVGSKELSESFLQCLDGNESKTTSPAKPGISVCGLCVRHMASADELSAHITSVHAKDVVNMHSILTNNTDLKTHKCPMCQLHFVSLQGVKEHIVASHLDGLQDTLKSLRINSLELPCPWCNNKSMSKELFQQHLASQHTHEFPETALKPSLKPEELAAKSLKAGNTTAVVAVAEAFKDRICLSCGAAFTRFNKLEQHMTTCSKDTTVGLHSCNFPDCSVPAFDTLDLLVGHVEEEHGATEICERRMFPNLNLFGSWLKHEQQKCGQKYLRSTSRVKSGCCNVAYLCPSYNTTAAAQSNKSAQCCFSRMHVRTRWCHSKFDYCGRTEVTYYKSHQHCPAAAPSTELKDQFQASDRAKEDELADAASDGPDDSSNEARPRPGPKSKTQRVPDDSLENASDSSSSPSYLKTSINNNNINKKKCLDRPVRTPVPKQQLTSTSTSSISKQDKIKQKVLSSNNQRAREEIMIEDDTEDKVVANANNSRRKVIPKGNNSFKSSRNMVVGGKNGNNNLRKGPLNKRKGGGNIAGQPAAKKAKLVESLPEETTYVLPANLSEWCKLFDMVDSQIGSGSLNESDVPEASSLLKHKNDITVLPLEEQVRVFHRLCNLANIQVD